MLGTRTAGLPDCRPLLADPDDLTLVFGPIVDLVTATVAGYATMARFPGTSGPDAWFAAAADAGLGAELEALAISKALLAADRLPAGTFLTVDSSPHLLGTAPVQAAFASRPDLSGVVVVLTGHTPADGLAALHHLTDLLRGRGAVLAMDTAGSSCSGLQQMAVLRPRIVTVDLPLVADGDPVRSALAEFAGEFAGKIDAALLADGIETPAELATAARLGVPLARGWLFGPPARTFEPLAPDVVRLVRAQVVRTQGTGTVASLVRPVRQATVGEDVPGIPPVVLVGPHGEPAGLLLSDLRTAEVYTAAVSLVVSPSTDVADALRSALARPPAQRFDPIVCTDPSGAVLGLLRVDDLAAAR